MITLEDAKTYASYAAPLVARRLIQEAENGGVAVPSSAVADLTTEIDRQFESHPVVCDKFHKLLDTADFFDAPPTHHILVDVHNNTPAPPTPVSESVEVQLALLLQSHPAVVATAVRRAGADVDRVLARAYRDVDPVASFDSSDSESRAAFYTDLYNYLRMLSTHPGAAHARRLRELGNNLMVVQSYPQAIQAYTSALASGLTASASAQIRTNRAIAYIGLNCYREARADLVRAVAADRCCVPAWTQLAYVHLYMGDSLWALQCYLTALQATAGVILPRPDAGGRGGIDASDAQAVEQYQQAKIATVMPQFIRRLVQLMILVEKRCKQQMKPADEVAGVVSHARAVLAKLRAHAQPEDMAYYTYLYDYDDNSVRATAERASRAEPTMWTREVSQDVLAGTEIEAVPISATVTAGPEGLLDPADRGPVLDATEIGSGDGMRNMLNSFGEIFEGTMGAQTEVFPGRDQPERSRSDPGANRPEQTNQNQSDQPTRSDQTNDSNQQSQQNPGSGPPNQVLGNLMRQYLPEGLGDVLSLALGSVTGGNLAFITVNGRQFDFSGNPVGNNNTERSDRSDDVDMPDVPDLD